MNRKLSVAVLLALVLVLATSVTLFAQGNGPGTANQQAWQSGQILASQDGTGNQYGRSNDGQWAPGRGTGTPTGLGANYVDEDGDDVCDHYEDSDGDGRCDNCTQEGTGQMMRRGGGNQDGSGNRAAMHRSAGRQGRNR